jgi:predicted RNA-binding Zn-ribbon protein involved in translation (DUF1610 family)
MELVKLPWGSVLLSSDAPSRMEMILNTSEDSLRWRCYLRLDFVDGECRVTVRPLERVVCASCGCDLVGDTPEPGEKLECLSCGQRSIARGEKVRIREQAFDGVVQRVRGKVVRPAAWDSIPEAS